MKTYLKGEKIMKNYRKLGKKIDLKSQNNVE